MKADYKNWVPLTMKKTVWRLVIVFAFLFVIALMGAFKGSVVAIILTPITAILFLVFMGAGSWCSYAYAAFSYNGKKQISRKIIERIANNIANSDGNILDVGCGSGALAIAVAKSNPGAKVCGCDLWSGAYGSFTKSLCESNAEAEGVDNISFEPGDARKLPFEDGVFDWIVSNYVYHNIPSSDRGAILLESLRTVKKGGSFCIHDVFSKAKYGDVEVLKSRLEAAGFCDIIFENILDGILTKREASLLGLSSSLLLKGRRL